MISVIIPYKNAADYIERCANSCASQTGDFEFIFVNDNSVDNSEKLLREHSDDRFILANNEHNNGVSGARNTGLDIASGDWITFLDVDDELLPNAYKTLTSVLKRKANIYQFNHLRWNAKKNRVIYKYQNQGGLYTIDKLPEAWFAVWNKLFRGELVKDIRFDERTQFGEDGLFVLKCLSKDERILHAEFKKRVCKHNLENKESLSHQKTGDDLLKQVHLYEEFMLTQSDPKMRVAVCNEISVLWARKRMKEALRGWR